jgi:hypothetical protein
MEMIQHLGKIARIDCSDDIRLEVIKDRAIRITVVNTVKYYPVKNDQEFPVIPCATSIE